MQLRLLLLTYCMIATPPALAEALRWGFSSSDPAPYVSMQGDELGPSVTRSLGALVASRLGRQIEFIEVPNNRLEPYLRGGRIDLACHILPAWHPEPQEPYWSKPLYHDANVVVTRGGGAAPKHLDDMQGMRVGTGHDRHYSAEVLRAFSRGHLQRLNVRDMPTRLRMVEHDRLDASIERRAAVLYYLKRHPRQSLSVATWTLSELPLRCAAEQTHRKTGKAAVRVVNQLIRENRVETIWAEFN